MSCQNLRRSWCKHFLWGCCGGTPRSVKGAHTASRGRVPQQTGYMQKNRSLAAPGRNCSIQLEFGANISHGACAMLISNIKAGLHPCRRRIYVKNGNQSCSCVWKGIFTGPVACTGTTVGTREPVSGSAGTGSGFSKLKAGGDSFHPRSETQQVPRRGGRPPSTPPWRAPDGNAWSSQKNL